MATTRSIICISHTPIKRLESEFDLFLVNSTTSPKEVRKKSCLFTNIHDLTRLYKYLKKPPVLAESSYVHEMISLNHFTYYADFKIDPNGIITFLKLKKDKVNSLLQCKWRSTGLIVLDGENVFQYGKHKYSEFAREFNLFLTTLPSFIRVATIVAFVTAIRHRNWEVFNRFLEKNRLVTNLNIKSFNILRDRLNILQPYIEALLFPQVASEDTVKESLTGEKSRRIYRSLHRVAFYLSKYEKMNLEDFLDDEENVNLVKKVLNKGGLNND